MKIKLFPESRSSVHDSFNVLTGEWDNFDYSNPKICHGKGSGGGTNTVTSNSSPPPEVLAAYQQALAGAQTASSAPLQQYQGNTVAPFTADQNSAFDTINNSQGIAQPFINQAQNLITQGTQPLWSGVQQFSPSAVQNYMSPYTSNVVNAQTALEQNQDAQQQQSLKGNTIASGAWGGDRAGVASAILSGQQDLANNATNSNILQQGYNTGLQEFNTQQQAQLGANEANAYLNQQGAFGLGQLGSEALSSNLAGANAQLTAGGLEQQQAQSQLNVPYQQFLQQQAYPFQTAQYYANIAEGIGSNSGGTGTSNSTTPGPSVGSQIGGGVLGAAGLYGALGGFSSGAGAYGLGLGSLGLFAARGGRIKPKGGFASGGVAHGFAAGGEIPDLSISYVPSSGSGGTHGAGPPRPPNVQQSPQQTEGDTNQLLSLVSAISKGLGKHGSANLGGLDPAATSTWGAGENLDQSFGEIAPQAAQASEIQNFMGPTQDSGFGTFQAPGNWFRGGVAHYDDGGTVGGMSPTTAMMQGQQQPTAAANYNNMTPEQLQNYLMRLPAGSAQQRAVQSALQQKRMMPNVGTQAQGGFGAQQPQQTNSGFARGGFADGGMPDDGIYLDSPPPDRGILARHLDLQSELVHDSPVPQVSSSDLAPPSRGNGPPPPPSVETAPPQPTGAFGTRAAAPTAEAARPTGTPQGVSDYTDNLNARQHAEPNPWLSLAKAGFAIAAGRSPYAMENIGAGAVAGINDYQNQQKESDTVNQGVDKLLAEAKQHRESLAQEQQKENDAQNYRQAALGQGKYTPSRDPMTGGLDLINTKTGEIIHHGAAFSGAPNSAAGTGDTGAGTSEISLANAYTPPKGPDGKPLTGDAYLATLPPRVAVLTKQFGDLEQGVTPYMLTRGDPETKAAATAAANYRPGWSASQFANLQKYNFDPNGGQKEKALDTVVPHIKLLSDLIDAMDTGKTEVVNQLNNRFQTEFGLSGASANLKAAQQLVGNEIVTSTLAQGKGAGALADRQEVQEMIDGKLSKDILKSNIDKVYLPAMRAQANATGNTFKKSVGLDNFQQRLLPETQNALWGTLPPVDKREAGQFYTNAHGARAMWDGKGWVTQ